MAPAPHLAALLEKPSAREDRDMAVMLELGWNSLAGAGISYSYYAHPQFAVEMGGGLAVSPRALRFGARGRYNFSRANFTPYVALGASVVPGGHLAFEHNGAQVPLRVNTTPALQGTAGVSWQSDGGFVALFGVGYSYNLRTPYRTKGYVSVANRELLQNIFGHGPSVNLALGHAF